MQAILSDIHGNLEAIEAVLADAAPMGATSIVCLGDIIGHGPDPIACLELAGKWDFVVAGNFDYALLYEHSFRGWTRHVAAESVVQARHRLQIHPDGTRLFQFVAALPHSHQDAATGAIYLHGSPRHPLNEYVFPEDIYNTHKMSRVWEQFDSLCFHGHTHIPGIITESSCEESSNQTPPLTLGRSPGSPKELFPQSNHDDEQTNQCPWSFVTPDECGQEFDISDHKVLCNVGSVGQPRDGDNRACYVLFDGRTIRFRRVPYDFETTQQKHRDNGDDDSLGRRLAEGL